MTKHGIFVALVFWAFTSAHAENIGEVIRSVNMDSYPAGTLVSEATEIVTGPRQKIAFKTTQGDVLIAGENSSIQLVKPGFFSQLFGKVYYFFSPERSQEVTVQTTTATIGIRGTKFLIDSEAGEESNDKVSLVEGALKLEPVDDGYFALYRQREMTEFELYKKQQQEEFDAYKKQLVEEFVAYKKSIDLGAGYALSLQGSKATQIPLNDDIAAEIAEFEQFVSDNQVN